jgi:integrase
MAVVDRWKNADGSPSRDAGRGKRWLVRYRDPQGQQRSKSFERKADADSYNLETAVNVRTGMWADPAAGKQTFGTFAEAWLDLNRPQWRATTTRSMEQIVRNRLKPSIGMTPMARINAGQVQAMVNGWSGTYSPATSALNVQTFRTVMAAAIEAGVIGKDPAPKIKAPKRSRRRDAHLSHEDVATILATARGPVRPFLATLAWCGLRMGEGLGLDVADVDWLSGTVTVSKQQSTEYADSTVDAMPKTEAAYRSVPMPPELVAMCSEMLAGRRARTGALEDGYLWQATDGRRLQRTNVDSEIRRIRRVTKLSFSAHHLRHYYGAALLSQGVPIPQVAKQMGHASPQVTLRVYAYAMTDDAELGRAAVAQIAALSASCAPDVHPQAAGES